MKQIKNRFTIKTGNRILTGVTNKSRKVLKKFLLKNSKIISFKKEK